MNEEDGSLFGDLLKKIRGEFKEEIPSVVIPLHKPAMIQSDQDAMERYEHHVRMMSLRPSGDGFRRPRTSRKRMKARGLTVATLTRAEKLLNTAVYLKSVGKAG